MDKQNSAQFGSYFRGVVFDTRSNVHEEFIHNDSCGEYYVYKFASFGLYVMVSSMNGSADIQAAFMRMPASKCT